MGRARRCRPRGRVGGDAGRGERVIDQSREPREDVLGRLVVLDRRLRTAADVAGEIDDAHRQARAHELDADRVTRVRVDPQRPLEAPAAATASSTTVPAASRRRAMFDTVWSVRPVAAAIAGRPIEPLERTRSSTTTSL